MTAGREGERGPPRFLNCGTLLALFGVAVFALLGFVLSQILCHGPGGAVPIPRFPG
ncbi:MAG: hypothetical protein ACREMD_15830 [Gemmatimonadota bacterium]